MCDVNLNDNILCLVNDQVPKYVRSTGNSDSEFGQTCYISSSRCSIHARKLLMGVMKCNIDCFPSQGLYNLVREAVLWCRSDILLFLLLGGL
mmetsp:Transcript_46629/g.68916  ORF Transcript_46629/g.68916 Transcript_46629/m.68916 type:complete len:92 (+) Transcript_46629:228-503(+)